VHFAPLEKSLPQARYLARSASWLMLPREMFARLAALGSRSICLLSAVSRGVGVVRAGDDALCAVQPICQPGLLSPDSQRV
jgi:hypothetical protein